MDTGGFYRRGASITSSFAGPHVDMSHTYTSTPPPGQPPATSIPVEYTSVSQKLDQLLFLYLEEKKEISEFQDAVSSLTEKVNEVMERQEEAPTKKEQAAEGYKIPTDLSVSIHRY